MFCAKCGNQIAEGSAFCNNCGTAVTPQSAQQPVQEPVYQQPVYQQPVQPVQDLTPQPSMKWYKFLIYFSLWAGAVLNIFSAISMLTGSQYGTDGEAELVYAMFEDLKTLDMLCGIFALVLAVFSIYTRFQLAGFKQKAPMFLTILYAGVCVYDLIYIIGCTNALPEYVLSEMDFTSMYSNLVTSAVMIFVNMSYFKKRAHLFVN